jgi:chromodomain-helicase-DNA-binding protein 4
LITRKLTALKPVHKVLLTGTPLNNTVRELLNLMYFLDPEEWHNLDELEKHYENMTEELAKELRERIAPYMLRRRKEDVLDLPPKVSASIYR